MLEALISESPDDNETILLQEELRWLADNFEFLRLSHGNFYSNIPENLVITTINVWQEVIKTWVQGILSLMEFNSPRLEVKKSGHYEVTWSMAISMLTTGSGQEIQIGVMINGVIQPVAATKTTIKNASSWRNLADTGILDLNSEDEVSLGIRNVTSTNSVDIENASFTLTQLSR